MCIRDRIRGELQFFLITGYIKEYKVNWYKHLGKMQQDRLPKFGLNYKATWYRGVGRPRTRWFPEQAVEPNPWR